MSKPLDEMPVKCSGCAFTKGTEAERDALTQLTTELCLQSGEPFFCHANAVADQLPKDEKRVCRGYLEARALRAPAPAWKAAVAREGLILMEEAASGRDIQDAPARLLVAGVRSLPKRFPS